MSTKKSLPLQENSCTKRGDNLDKPYGTIDDVSLAVVGYQENTTQNVKHINPHNMDPSQDKSTNVVEFDEKQKAPLSRKQHKMMLRSDKNYKRAQRQLAANSKIITSNQDESSSIRENKKSSLASRSRSHIALKQIELDELEKIHKLEKERLNNEIEFTKSRSKLLKEIESSKGSTLYEGSVNNSEITSEEYTRDWVNNQRQMINQSETSLKEVEPRTGYIETNRHTHILYIKQYFKQRMHRRKTKIRRI